MLRFFALFFVFGCVNKALLFQSSCVAEQKPAGPEGAADCGCSKLKRDAAAAAVAAPVDPVEEEEEQEEEEDRAASLDPALKYSRGTNDRTTEAPEDEQKIDTLVRCDFFHEKESTL